MTTREQIIAAAKECNAVFDVIAYGRCDGILFSTNELDQFYAIAFEEGRKAEREDCAELCFRLGNVGSSDYVGFGANDCSAAINARSTK